MATRGQKQQTSELSQSGPLLSSYHYILDVGLLGEMAKILGNETLGARYSAMAERLWPVFNRVYLAEQKPSAGADPTCDESPELRKGGHTLKLSCPGSSIAAVEFAAFGTPSGSCAAGFSHNASCDSPGVQKAVESVCVGKESCAVSPVYGGKSVVAKKDPCTGTIKNLAVKVRCKSAPAPAPAPAPLFGYATPGQAAGQLEQVVMLARGLVPEEHQAAVEETLLREIAAAGSHITTGFIGNKYAWPALTRIGQAELAVDLALETTSPSYGYQIVNNATTLCESSAASAQALPAAFVAHGCVSCRGRLVRYGRR